MLLALGTISPGSAATVRRRSVAAHDAHAALAHCEQHRRALFQSPARELWPRVFLKCSRDVQATRGSTPAVGGRRRRLARNCVRAAPREGPELSGFARGVRHPYGQPVCRGVVPSWTDGRVCGDARGGVRSPRLHAKDARVSVGRAVVRHSDGGAIGRVAIFDRAVYASPDHGGRRLGGLPPLWRRLDKDSARRSQIPLLARREGHRRAQVATRPAGRGLAPHSEQRRIVSRCDRCDRLPDLRRRGDPENRGAIG